MINYDDFLKPDIKNIKESGIRKFFDLANDIPGTISLGVGEPDFVTPWEIRTAAIKSIQSGHTQYTSNAGLVSLREEIALYLSERFSLNYDPGHEIICTIGASQAIDLALRVLINAGDEVIIPAPSYVSYQPNVLLVGGTPVPITLDADNGFKLTPEILEKSITDKTKLLILPYPNNPTGAVMTKEELEKIVPIIKKHNLFVLSDEIYAELTYSGKHYSIAALDGMKERTILVNGFSKAFAMTGWRIGYIAAPLPIMTYVYRVHQYTIMCASTASQYAALAALKSGREENYETVTKMRDSYNLRRKFLYAEFMELGLTAFEPQGAFYIFPSVVASGYDGQEFAKRLIEEQKIAVVPGDAFGECGENFVRCCYATSLADLTKAVKGIRAFLKK